MQQKEKEANGVEMHGKLGCNTQRGSPCCVTPSPGRGAVGNELRGRAGRDAGMRQRRCPGKAGLGFGLCHREMFGENIPQRQCIRCEEQREGLGKAPRMCKISTLLGLPCKRLG